MKKRVQWSHVIQSASTIKFSLYEWDGGHTAEHHSIATGKRKRSINQTINHKYKDADTRVSHERHSLNHHHHHRGERWI